MYLGMTVVMGYVVAVKMQRFTRWQAGVLETRVEQLPHLHHSAPNVFTYAILRGTDPIAPNSFVRALLC